MSGSELLSGTDGDITVQLLGGFGVFCNSSALSVPRASQRLLAFLALRGRMFRRAVVAGTLWPDVPESRAYSNLRSALARVQPRVRSTLATSKLELGLADGVTVDMRDAQARARRLLDAATTPDKAHLGTATLTALSADLLPDWYDDWVLAEAEDWRQLRLHALESLACHLMGAGRWGEAAVAARAAVRAEPLRESGQIVLIQVYLAEGNQADAVRQFTRYRTLLRAELDLDPTSRMCELVQGFRSR